MKLVAGKLAVITALSILVSPAQAELAPVSSEASLALPKITSAFSKRDISIYKKLFDDNTEIVYEDRKYSPQQWLKSVDSRFQHSDEFRVVAHVIGLNSLTLVVKVTTSCHRNEQCEGVGLYEIERFEFGNDRLSRLSIFIAGNTASSNLE